MARRDNLTMELPGLPKRRGRPVTGKAKTNAQRQQAWRDRQADKPRAFIVTRNDK